MACGVRRREYARVHTRLLDEWAAAIVVQQLERLFGLQVAAVGLGADDAPA